jgi:uncharacterized membrane protein YfcA
VEITPELMRLAAVLLATGGLAGFSAGLFGIGGGAVMVPALYFVFAALGYPESVVMHTAVATSSAVIIISSIRSVIAHHAHQAVDWEVLWPRQLWRSWGLWIGLGAFLASAILARHISGPLLTLIFGAMMTLIALQFIFGRPDWTWRDSLPGGAAIPIGGGAIGAISALMGIGGGAISVTLMVICGKRIHRAIGTASGVGMFISIPATLGFILSGWGAAGRPPLSLGYVNLLGFVLIALTSILLIPLGARTAHKTDQKRLKLVFGMFLMLVSINMIRKSLF